MKMFLRSSDERKLSVEDIAKQFDMQYTQMAMELERTKNTIKRLNKMDSRLKDLENTISTEGVSVKSATISSRMKENIRVLIMKHAAVTSDQMSKILKLSRTRCNEYLKEMETDGILESSIKCRKKYYKLRQDR